MAYLDCTNLTAGYGSGDIITDCKLYADIGRVSAIVGPNGAGKSTAMKAILGLVTLSRGSVILDGKEISSLNPQDKIAEGMAFVPQIENVFPSLTVEENLEMGAFLRRDDITRSLQEVFDLFPVLGDFRRKKAGDLSGGQRQQVAVGRALMTQPKMLLLDEPSAGVSPIVMDNLFDMIIKVANSGIAVMICEQNAKQALEIADVGFVLVQGKNRFTDTGNNLLTNDQVRKSFLGG